MNEAEAYLLRKRLEKGKFQLDIIKKHEKRMVKDGTGWQLRNVHAGGTESLTGLTLNRQISLGG